LVCLGQVLLLVMSRSATSAISLLLMLGLTALALGVSIHERPVVRFFFLIVLVVGAICGLLLFGAYDSIHEMTGRSASLTGRTEIWRYVIQLIQARPWFGYGYGFWLAPSVPRLNMWLAMNWPMPHAHDEWLDITLQLGVIGLCIEVFCLALALARAVRLSFVLQDGKALFCGLIIVILCVRGYAETVLTDPAINGWVWLVISYLTLAHMAREKAAPAFIDFKQDNTGSTLQRLFERRRDVN
jgi:exopolysaccharide production protein ExoQ